jgi:hypothetical protein
MNQAEAIEQISKALSHLTYQVAQENFAGFFSKNRLLEDLLLPAFAILLQAPKLRNLNASGQNNAFLDFGDDENQCLRHRTAKLIWSVRETSPDGAWSK